MKIVKVLAYMGVVSTAAFIAYLWTNNSERNYSGTVRTLKGNPLEREASNLDRNEMVDANLENQSDNRAQLMYKNLGMTDEQRQQYEHDYHAVTGSWRESNPNYDLDDQQKIEYQSASLKAVLNEVQYAMYRDAVENR